MDFFYYFEPSGTHDNVNYVYCRANNSLFCWTVEWHHRKTLDQFLVQNIFSSSKKIQKCLSNDDDDDDDDDINDDSDVRNTSTRTTAMMMTAAMATMSVSYNHNIDDGDGDANFEWLWAWRRQRSLKWGSSKVVKTKRRLSQMRQWQNELTCTFKKAFQGF